MLLMTLFAMMSVTQLIFPYVEPLKSRRPFAGEIRKLVPLATPLYVYADSMNHFNS